MIDPATAVTLWLMSKDNHDLPSLDTLVYRPAWQAEAVCWGEPVGTFFPPRGGSLDRAKAL